MDCAEKRKGSLCGPFFVKIGIEYTGLKILDWKYKTENTGPRMQRAGKEEIKWKRRSGQW